MSDTTRQEQSITGSTVEVGFEIQRLIQQGWEIDQNRPLTFAAYGNLEVSFVRDASHNQLAFDAAELSKPTRAEILAKARQAKADKREQEITTNV